MDLISPAVAGHHRRVGYIAARIGQAMALGSRDLADLLFAGMLHDAGAFSLKSRLDALDFDTQEQAHAEVGARLLSCCPILAGLSEVVRRHHTHWSECRLEDRSEREALLGNVLHCADRVDAAVLRGGREEALRLIGGIPPGTWFAPYVVQAFADAASSSAFWEGFAEVDRDASALSDIPFHNQALGLESISEFSEAVSYIIDFRSRFTATHSKGVSAAAGKLAALAGMSSEDARWITVAGDLHDLGKLGVSKNILEKPGPLTREERAIIMRHPEDTVRALSCAPELAQITRWAGNHHESINGDGYPAGLSGADLDLGSRIVAVADVFTAVAEDRPYREGMSRSQALDILHSMAKHAKLDKDVVGLLSDNYEALDHTRRGAQEKALAIFQEFCG
jgi:HD-GYP domain-containing protein (c-di-GMP phosphodiesterase class II)